MNDQPHNPSCQETQALALGSYRHDVAYTAALKSIQGFNNKEIITDVEYGLASVIFFRGVREGAAA